MKIDINKYRPVTPEEKIAYTKPDCAIVRQGPHSYDGYVPVVPNGRWGSIKPLVYMVPNDFEFDVCNDCLENFSDGCPYPVGECVKGSCKTTRKMLDAQEIEASIKNRKSQNPPPNIRLEPKPFVLEKRYVVLKLKNIREALTDTEIEILEALRRKVESVRKAPLDGVVIESDWPEYKPVLKMIEDRMAKA